MIRNTLRSVLRPVYNRVLRESLPRKIGVYNGVAVRYPRFLDIDDHFPAWKDGTVSAVRNRVVEGDTVVDVGTGFGVCSVWAARRAGPDGEVRSYEASAERVEIARETLGLNGVSGRVTVTHALVGTEVEVFGRKAGPERLDIEDLPRCDVIVTDCEGAEMSFVDEIHRLDPRVALVESHGFAGSPSEELADRLRSTGFSVDRVADASPFSDPEEDNKVVVGTRSR